VHSKRVGVLYYNSLPTLLFLIGSLPLLNTGMKGKVAVKNGKACLVNRDRDDERLVSGRQEKK